MNKPLLLAGSGLLLVCLLFFFGRTTEPKKTDQKKSSVSSFNIDIFIADAKRKLTPSQTIYLSGLENSVKRGDVVAQQIKAYQSIASFWKDSIKAFEPYAYYTIEATKLDNSEKSLTFAAQLLLEGLRGEQDQAKVDWESTQAISLFEKALQLNPENDELKIGLGSVYVYGKGKSGGSQATMKGIQQLLSVVRKDSMNMKAQLVLGVGGLVSGQYEKAIERFKKVVENEPNNVEAIAYLADTYAAMGNKQEAVKWYTITKKMVNDPHYSKEVDERIKTIR